MTDRKDETPQQPVNRFPGWPVPDWQRQIEADPYWHVRAEVYQRLRGDSK